MRIATAPSLGSLDARRLTARRGLDELLVGAAVEERQVRGRAGALGRDRVHAPRLAPARRLGGAQALREARRGALGGLAVAVGVERAQPVALEVGGVEEVVGLALVVAGERLLERALVAEPAGGGA